MNMFDQLKHLKPPALYEPGEALFWNDPHISRQMLKAHLDQSTDRASYQFERIDGICSYLEHRLKLEPGDRIIDLGCGPGLYSSRLAEAGYRVKGLDLSVTSIEYARGQAAGRARSPEYSVGNYLQWHETACYEAALLIFEDFGVLPPEGRRKLLANIHEALIDNGSFVLDVASVYAFEARKKQPARNWQAVQQGFWRSHPHIVLEELILFEDEKISCDQYVVCDNEIKVYRVYQTYYTPESITGELEEAGFAVEEVLSSLDGEAWQEGSPQIGVVCHKK